MLGHHSERIHERRNDLRSDVVQDVPQDAVNVVMGADSHVLAERYRVGELALHLHFGVRRVNAETGDLCAVFERRVRDRHVYSGYLSELSNRVKNQVAALVSLMGRKHRPSQDAPDDVQNTVSVYAGKFVEMPEPMISRRSPDLERLQPLDTCPVFSGEVSNLIFRSFSSEGIAGIADWKRRLAVGRRLAGEDCKLPREMIEGGSQVLQTISDEKTEGKRRGLSDVNPEDMLAAVRLSLVGDEIRFSLEKRADLSIERFQVLLCPVEL